MSENTCRFCGSKKILQVNAKCKDLFSAKMPGQSKWSDGYNFVSGLMKSGDNDYVECDICLACQRVQDDLFKYSDKPKRGEKVWTVEEKLADLKERAVNLLDKLSQPQLDLESKLMALRAVDRCLPGLVRDLEKQEAARPCRSGKVYIRRAGAQAEELALARLAPEHYEIVD